MKREEKLLSYSFFLDLIFEQFSRDSKRNEARNISPKFSPNSDTQIQIFCHVRQIQSLSFFQQKKKDQSPDLKKLKLLN